MLNMLPLIGPLASRGLQLIGSDVRIVNLNCRTLNRNFVESNPQDSGYKIESDCDPSDASASALVLPLNSRGLILRPNQTWFIPNYVRVGRGCSINSMQIKPGEIKPGANWDNNQIERLEFNGFDPNSQFIEVLGDHLGLWWNAEETELAKTLAPKNVTDAVRKFNTEVFEALCRRVGKEPAIYQRTPIVKAKTPRYMVSFTK